MSRYCTHNIKPILDAAEAWRNRCLIEDGSILSNDHFWNIDNLNELHKFFTENPDEGNRSFLDKLQDQLTDSDPGVKKLAAEMLWFMYLFIYKKSMKVETKKAQITRVWDWSGEKLDEAQEYMNAPLELGVGNPGTAYNTRRWAEFRYFIDILIAIKNKDDAERNNLLTDPWVFSSWLDTFEEHGRPQLRHIIKFLLFPDHFERICTGKHKREIVNAFHSKNIKTGKFNFSDLDKEIYKIRQEMEAKYETGELDFYNPPLKDVWQATTQTGIKEPSSDRSYSSVKYWIVAPGERARKWDEFYYKGIVGLGWDEIGDLTQYKNREKITQKLLDTYVEGSKTRTNDSLALWQFSREMKPGDFVITKRGNSEYLGYGVVSSDYYYDDLRDEFKHVRKVDWKTKGTWHEENGPIVLKTLTDITKYSDYVNRLKSLIGIGQEQNMPNAENYWWLNANPRYWKIDDFEIGQEQSYTTHNEKGNKRQKYEYFTKVKPGDLVIGYESTPVKKVTAIFEITRGIHVDDEDGDEKISFVIKQFFPPGERLSWEQVRNMPELSNCEILKNNQGSLFRLERPEFEALVDESSPQAYETYEIDEALAEVFISEDKLRNILYSLKNKKNIILQGPPGTGKTFIAKRLAYLLFGVKDRSRIEMVQFHQSYSYEDFIQGYRPGGKGFKLKNGVFYNYCKTARNDPSANYVFIIDEINRGNLSKIFGELMMLIEADKRGPEWSMALTYSDSHTEKFYVPENLYILGLMNTADRSLAMVDYALRRRFAFVDLEPGFSTKAFREHLLENGASTELIDKIIAKMNIVNARISRDAGNLGKGYCIGHSFFCATPEQGGADEDWYKHVIETEIAPLLREYWFDDPEQADSIIQDILLSD